MAAKRKRRAQGYKGGRAIGISGEQGAGCQVLKTFKKKVYKFI